jgi:hypothetical protein
LYCSGAREPEYGEAIAVFLARHPRDTPHIFLSKMPAMIRRQQRLSAFLASPEFEKHGWTGEALQQVDPTRSHKVIRPAIVSPARTRILIGAIVAGLLLILLALLVGMVTIVRAVAAWMWCN